ncbi:DinB family protein [Pedobacter immunditicola]|uniref:DinB family protein n=1 Tax=Pedobacter immunditicola TaxID=3133440 RepID=UPI0030A87EBC
MHNAQLFSSIHHLTEAYRTKLSTIDDEQFQLTPSVGGWSYSEVYSHIFDSSILSLKAMENCLEGKGKKHSTAFIVKIILFLGYLPPGRKYKVPQKLESRVKKMTKVEAEELIQRFAQQLEPDYKKMGKARADIKTPHPRLGYLNARQWLRFIEIHLKHHLKQLKRIENSF